MLAESDSTTSSLLSQYLWWCSEQTELDMNLRNRTVGWLSTGALEMPMAHQVAIRARVTVPKKSHQPQHVCLSEPSEV